MNFGSFDVVGGLYFLEVGYSLIHSYYLFTQYYLNLTQLFLINRHFLESELFKHKNSHSLNVNYIIRLYLSFSDCCNYSL